MDALFVLLVALMSFALGVLYAHYEKRNRKVKPEDRSAGLLRYQEWKNKR